MLVIGKIQRERAADFRNAYAAMMMGGKLKDHYHNLQPDDCKTFPPITLKELKERHEEWLNHPSVVEAREKSRLKAEAAKEKK